MDVQRQDGPASSGNHHLGACNQQSTEYSNSKTFTSIIQLKLSDLGIRRIMSMPLQQLENFIDRITLYPKSWLLSCYVNELQDSVKPLTHSYNITVNPIRHWIRFCLAFSHHFNHSKLCSGATCFFMISPSV